MSAETPHAAPVVPATPEPPVREEVTIVSHSNLFYWWPVWALGFVLAGLTAIGNHVMAVIPNDFEVKTDWIVKDGDRTEVREGILLNPGKDARHTNHLPRDADGKPEPIHLLVTKNKSFGVLFTTVLLIVIVITNVPLRGMWSVVVIMLIVLLSIIFALADLWTPIIRQLSLLDIRINMGGYLVMASSLFVIWLVTFMFFDRQLYIKFTPGQFRVVTEIGGGEKVFDTMGMTIEKQRSDLFRHWILGLGSGDLVIKTTGAQAQHFDLHNVLFIGTKVAQMEEMLRKRTVMEQKS